MKRIEVILEGKAYPCVLSMGAMVRFEEKTGKPISQMDETSVKDSIVYLYSTIEAGCQREQKEFPYDMLQLADLLTPAEFRTLVSALAGGDDGGEAEKKEEGKPINVYEMMGVALGVLHLSFSDFMLLTPDEFGQIWEAHNQREENLMHDRWELMRMHAAITIQPHVKNRLTPDKLLPLPWERPQRHGGEKESLTPQERKARFLKRISK